MKKKVSMVVLAVMVMALVLMMAGCPAPSEPTPDPTPDPQPTPTPDPTPEVDPMELLAEMFEKIQAGNYAAEMEYEYIGSTSDATVDNNFRYGQGSELVDGNVSYLNISAKFNRGSEGIEEYSGENYLEAIENNEMFVYRKGEDGNWLRYKTRGEKEDFTGNLLTGRGLLLFYEKAPNEFVYDKVNNIYRRCNSWFMDGSVSGSQSLTQTVIVTIVIIKDTLIVEYEYITIYGDGRTSIAKCKSRFSDFGQISLTLPEARPSISGLFGEYLYGNITMDASVFDIDTSELIWNALAKTERLSENEYYYFETEDEELYMEYSYEDGCWYEYFLNEDGEYEVAEADESFDSYLYGYAAFWFIDEVMDEEFFEYSEEEDCFVLTEDAFEYFAEYEIAITEALIKVNEDGEYVLTILVEDEEEELFGRIEVTFSNVGTTEIEMPSYVS